MTPKFDLGVIVATPGAIDAAARLNRPLLIVDLIHRHVTGDWAELNVHDRDLNELAVSSGMDRVLSVYTVEGVKFYVITEWDRRSVTTVLLPEEY